MKVTFENKAVIGGLKDLRKSVLKDTVNAINKAATKSKKRVDKKLASITGAKVTRVKKLSKVVRARAFGTIRMWALIVWKGKPLSIYNLGRGRNPTKPSGTGSTIKLKSGTKFYRGAFKVTVNQGRHTGLFRRIGPYSPGRHNNPITEIMMESNPDLFKRRGIGFAESKEALKDVGNFYNINVQERLVKFNRGS